ncbi:hypothetical protein GCM10028821_22260 [Hymenobacter jeollabukensis]
MLRPKPVAPQPAEPSWWDRMSAVVLENWTGILGAVVLVTGVGFLGVYTALKLAPVYRFLLINLFAGSLLGGYYYLRTKPFAAQLAVWLQSSAAAIFLFTCVGAVSIPGLRWVEGPLGYLLLFAGAAANLWLAWNSSREAVSSLHGILSLVALAVLPPTLLTLGAAAAVTAFAIAITYRQRWRHQLLLSIVSFFAFHLYWHGQLTPPMAAGLRLGAMALVLLVGLAAAVVQYRKVYANGRFDALLFAAHVLNWTCLGINLYLYSTGSVWKTIPLGLGAITTFWVARQARRLGIQWLFQTDTVISLILALATALSLQGWHATVSVILVFMLLETLLVAFIMARQEESLVFQIASVGALLAGGGLLLVNLLQLPAYSATGLHRNALLLFLAAAAGAAYFHLARTLPLLTADTASPLRRELYRSFGGLVGGLYVGAAALVLRALFGTAQPPVLGLIGASTAAAAAVLALSQWLRNGAPWFRQLHLLAAQLLLTVAVLGLHELGLGWPATLLILYAETLAAALLLIRRAEARVPQMLTAAALLTGLLLLLVSLFALPLPVLTAAQLYRRAGSLLLAALLGAAFFRLGHRTRSASFDSDTDPLSGLGTWAGALIGLHYTGLLLVLAQAFFGPAPTSIPALLAATVAAAGCATGVSLWLRGGAEWLRQLHLLAAQALLAVAVLGLHELGLSWPTTLLILYAETLAATLLLARRAEARVPQVLAITAQLTGLILLLLGVSELLQPNLAAAQLYRRAAGLLLAAVLGAAFFRLTSATRQAETPPPAEGGLAFWAGPSVGVLIGLHYTGLLLVLAQSFFGPTPTSIPGLLLGTVAAAACAFGVSQWLRGTAEWLRQLHVLIGQSLLMLAALGLHELGLSWPATALLLYLETLLMTLLLALRREWPLYRVLLYATLLLALGLVPAVSRIDSLLVISPNLRALLLLTAAVATAAAQALLARRDAPAYDALPLAYDPTYRLRLLGLVAGLLPLAAAALVYQQGWAAWAAVLVGAGMLALRRTVAVPGLWLGVLLSSSGFGLLQWHHAAEHQVLQVGPRLLYLLPTALLPLAGLAASWWAARARHVRWPWLYLLGLHLGATAWLAFHFRSDAAPVLLWTLLAAATFAAARWLQTGAAAEAQQRAGQPARYVLHLGYVLLGAALLYHLGPVLGSRELLLGWPARRFTAAALLALMGTVSLLPAPAAATQRSWRLLHPWLPELTLLLAGFTLHWETRVIWHAPLEVLLALLLAAAAPRLPLRLRRLGLYALPLYWLAAATAAYVTLRYLHPGAWLAAPWLTTTGAVALLFALAAVLLRRVPVTKGLQWPPGLQGLAQLGRLRFRWLVPLLLYPAFGVLTLLLLQSFDRSVLTVLLMLEVVGVFVSSLLLRRRDLRYVALAGIGVCMVRLVFFDLSQRGTITQAVVFIFMGLLLLGMNALYARFKGRFADSAEVTPEDFVPDDPDAALTP